MQLSLHEPKAANKQGFLSNLEILLNITKKNWIFCVQLVVHLIWEKEGSQGLGFKRSKKIEPTKFAFLFSD